MGPYRTPAEVPPQPQVRTARGRIRSAIRRFLVRTHGRFVDRYPVKCPCGKRSWDPEHVRAYGRSMSAGTFSRQANSYRCGQRHGLRNTVYLG